MPVQEVIPRIRKQRTINYGNTETVNGTGKVVLFDYDGEQATPLLVTVQCTDFSVGGAVGDFRPYAAITWGHGGADVETEGVDCTFRGRFPVVASAVKVEVFVASFALPGEANPRTLPGDLVAKFRGFLGEGLDGLRIFSTRWITQIDQSEGLIAEGQQRLAAVRVFNPGANVEYFQLFDLDAPPVNGDIPDDGGPVPPVNAVTGGLVPIPMGETRGFVNGIAWGMSSTPFVFTATGTHVFVSAEIEQ